MRIITINVNGIRAAERKGFFDWLKKQNADVVCLQEIKAQEDQLDDRFYPDDMHTFYHSAERKGYSGTGLYCRSNPDRISFSPWDDMNSEGRIIQADFGDLSVLSIYLPSGSSKEERQALKMEFIYERFLPHLKDLQKDGRKYIICGDWNIAHKKIDLKNWRSNQKNSGFLPEERAWLDILYDEVGFIDSFREIIRKSSSTPGGPTEVRPGPTIPDGGLIIRWSVQTLQGLHDPVKSTERSASQTTLH